MKREKEMTEFLNIRVPETVLQQLQQLAQERGATVTGCARRAILREIDRARETGELAGAAS